jgi:hypothetical protein
MQTLLDLYAVVVIGGFVLACLALLGVKLYEWTHPESED